MRADVSILIDRVSFLFAAFLTFATDSTLLTQPLSQAGESIRIDAPPSVLDAIRHTDATSLHAALLSPRTRGDP